MFGSVAPVPLTLEQVNQMTEDEFVQSLAKTFESGAWILQRTYQQHRPFATVVELHDKMILVLNSATREEKIAFLGHHPEIRGAVVTPDISDHSKNEAASVGLDALSQDEFNELERLNTEYRAKFGFPFMLSLRRHTKDMIFSRYNRRMLNEVDSELQTAIDEITLITRLRILNMVSGPGAPKTTGSLTTHVLDTVKGKPAAGVTIELFEVSAAGNTLLTSAVTNADGRTDSPLISNQPLRIGTYELQFHIGSYFRATSRDLVADPAFLDIIPIRFAISEPESHYHVPLLASPWSYSTYRGS
jgi:2-oxo-4-hydroxy-4-carboxy-5-ureidoimidazoline decarboxylase